MRKCLCVSRMNCTSESAAGTAYKLSHALWHRVFCCEVAELLENYWFVLSIFLRLAIFLFTLHFIGDFDSRFEVFDRRFYPDASFNWALFCPSQEYFIGVCGCFSHSVLEASTQSHFLAHFLAYEYIFETQRMPVCLNYMRARSQALATRCCTFRVCVFFSAICIEMNRCCGFGCNFYRFSGVQFREKYFRWYSKSLRFQTPISLVVTERLRSVASHSEWTENGIANEICLA